MIKIAITGNIACGKTLVENLIRQEGYFVADSDKIVHDLYQSPEIISKITSQFSDNVLTNEKIDRKKLGNIVFNDTNKLKNLENIIHPEVKKEIVDIFEKKKDEELVFISVPQLFEANMQNLFDYIITVKTSIEKQLERLIQRNNYSKDEALKRINSQMSQETKEKLANFVIDNSGTTENTRLQLFNILKKILNN